MGPLLTRYAVTRQPGQEIPGRYCSLHRMWVVDLVSGVQPLIDVSGALAELTTKTKVNLESDDSTDVAALQLVTKTDVQQERDDESRWAGSLLSLLTKTEVAGEQDKQDCDASVSALLELTTKTAVSFEQDRQDRDMSCAEMIGLPVGTPAVTEQHDCALPQDASRVPLAARLRH